MQTVFMFSGKGSQYYQMGRDFLESHPIFRKHAFSINEMLSDYCGISVLDKIHAESFSAFDSMEDGLDSCLAIYLIELAVCKTLAEEGIYPDIVLGSSFGTLVASVVSGCIGEESMVKLVADHVDVFREKCPPGSMIAVFDSPEIYSEYAELSDRAEVAGHNFSSCFVLSFPDVHRAVIEAQLERLRSSYQAIPISRAYHSRWIDGARNAFGELYGTLNLKEGKVNLICTSRKRIVRKIDADFLWQTVRAPMHFPATIEYLEGFGSYKYIDVGSSGLLATALKYVLPRNSRSKAFPLITPFQQTHKNLAQLLGDVRERRS